MFEEDFLIYLKRLYLRKKSDNGCGGESIEHLLLQALSSSTWISIRLFKN